MHYEPTRESVSTHPLPAWFDNAKLGIFIHWGLYSVPAWAPLAGELGDVLANGDWGAWFAANPYAEWYMNSLRIPGSPTQQHHAATYGADFPYRGFAPMFNAAAKQWDPAAWADLFARVHARYVVLTTKHHDGFLLWPSATPNPFIPNYHAERDLPAELAEAVRSRGLVMALYYSGGLDWTFNDHVIQDLMGLAVGVPQSPEYVAYANAHWRELIDRYQTMVLWNDIAYPQATDLNVLFAEYYNRLPEGVVNNRFTQHFQMGADGIISDNHFDFETPEYASFAEIRAKKWESCRGVGASFGYSRNEGPEHHLSVENLVRSFVDIVSKNGNLLLNIGPTAEGEIPPLQLERLLGLGRWLDVNGEAIFDTRPWVAAESTAASTATSTGASQPGEAVPVRFTQKPGELFATLLGAPAQRTVTIAGVACAPGTTVRLLGAAAPLRWEPSPAGVCVTLPESLPDSPAHVLGFAPQPAWRGG